MPIQKKQAANVAVTLLITSLVLLNSQQLLAQKGGGGGKPKTANYTVIALEAGEGYFESEARGLNDGREAVGFAKTSSGVAAVHWRIENGQAVPTILGLGDALPGSTTATAVNRWGQIVGSGDILVDGSGEFEQRERALFWPGKSSTPLLLPTLDGFEECWPLALSDDGLIIGVARHDDLCSPYWTAVAWRILAGETGPYPSDVLDFGAIEIGDFSSATGVSNTENGVALVSGTSEVPLYDETGCLLDTLSVAVSWSISLDEEGGLSATPPSWLGPLCGGSQSWGNGVNNAGAISGVSETADGGLCGFIDDGELQVLEATRKSRLDRQSIRDVNDANTRQAVGHLEDSRSGAWFAVVWTNGSPKEVSSLASESAFSSFVDAHNINERGDIVGVGDLEVGGRAGFLLLKNE